MKLVHDQLLAMNSAPTSTQLIALVLSIWLLVTKNKLEFDDLSSFLIEEEAVPVSQGKLCITSSSKIQR
eukprot:c43901_g1_i1 orf=75-281(+)